MRTTLILICTVFAALVLVACDSSSSSSTPTAPPQSPTSAVSTQVITATAVTPTPVRNDKLTVVAGLSPAQAADLVARTVTASRPLLFPNAIADDWTVEASALDANSFTLQFKSPDGAKSVFLALVAANPRPPEASSSQQMPGFHGDPNSLYQVQDKNDPASFRYLLWEESGTWGAQPADSTVPYYMSADGLTHEEFWDIANSLHPVQR